MSERWNDSPDRVAYMVWLCGGCDSHTVETNQGDHQCETCGDRYDHRGVLIPDPEDDEDEVDPPGAEPVAGTDEIGGA